MAAGRQGVQRGPDQVGGNSRGLDRDRVILAVKDDGGYSAEAGERGAEIEISEAGPHLLMGAAGHSTRSQVARPCGIVEVGRYRELEDALLEGGRVALAEAAFPEASTLFLEDGIQVALAEARLVTLPGRAPGRRRRHQGEPLESLRMLEAIEQREECAPGIAGEGEAVERPALAERLEVGHLLGPADRDVTGHRRPAAASLVVVDELASDGERIEAGQQIVMVRPGAAVEHDGGRPGADPANEEGDPAYRLVRLPRGHGAHLEQDRQ